MDGWMDRWMDGGMDGGSVDYRSLSYVVFPAKHSLASFLVRGHWRMTTLATMAGRSPPHAFTRLQRVICVIASHSHTEIQKKSMSMST